MLNVTIATRSQAVHAGRAQGRPLSILPILGPSHDKPVYRLLDEQILPSVQVTEVTEGGSVQELSVHNQLDEMVFLMDGQELVGAKQNRILNTDVLVPGKTKLPIPVSCVEAHRWSYNSPHFLPGKSASHRIRSSKEARVHQALKLSGRHDADQGLVWEDVASSLASNNVKSSTSSLHDAYDARQKELVAFRAKLRLPAKAVGLAVFRGATFQGLDLFDRHDTLKYFWESLVDSYAIDFFGAEAPPADVAVTVKAIDPLLEKISTGQWEPFKSPGDGQDWRLEDPAFSGSALVWGEETVIHLQLFPKQPVGQTEGAMVARRPRVHRPWMRQ